jgi:hypothetical protein
MAEPIILDSLTLLGRALLACLTPASGVRATGTITATAGAAEIEIPKNTYLLPVVGGKMRDDLVFKTSDSWTLPANATESGIPITSNIGGARHNLPDGTRFRFDPPLVGVDLTATLDAAITNGSDEGQIVRTAVFFEELDTGNPTEDLFAAKVGEGGVMLVWTNSDPVDGTMAGLRQGATRATRAARFWRENFVLYVVASGLGGDEARRKPGRLIMQAVTRLLTDRHQNDDGEQLSSVGAGVEITSRARLGRNDRHYIYAMTLRANQTLQPGVDARTFERWTTTHYRGELPGREAPEPIQDLEVVDAVDPMP